jgi:hypothetical protein
LEIHIQQKAAFECQTHPRTTSRVAEMMYEGFIDWMPSIE